MSIRKFLSSRVFFIQLLIAIVLIVILLWLIMFGLKTYTRNGQSNPVPDFFSMNISEAEELASQHNLIIEVLDSAYNDLVAPGEIIDQVPEKGLGVKEKRTVFVTINSSQAEQISVPKLTDISFRQAQVLIENSGLIIGNISYQPSEYNNLVLKVDCDSIEIQPGEQLPKGSVINLVLGRDQGNSTTPLPRLIGLTIQEAQSTITNSMLNPGVLIYDESILTEEDSINARVWKQRPTPKISANVNLGSSIDLWITVNEEKIEKEPEQNLNF